MIRQLRIPIRYIHANVRCESNESHVWHHRWMMPRQRLSVVRPVEWKRLHQKEKLRRIQNSKRIQNGEITLRINETWISCTAMPNIRKSVSPLNMQCFKSVAVAFRYRMCSTILYDPSPGVCGNANNNLVETVQQRKKIHEQLTLAPLNTMRHFCHDLSSDILATMNSFKVRSNCSIYSVPGEMQFESKDDSCLSAA